MDIKVADLFRIANLKDYKLHFAVYNKTDEPLDVFLRNRDEWRGWNAWRPRYRDDFNRPYIFSMMRFYHQPARWLFGGIYKVVGRHATYNDVELTDQYQGYIGRLLIHHPGPGIQGRAFLPDRYYSDLLISQIFDKAYSGEEFCGCEKINHEFAVLEPIFKQGRADWKAALRDLKGVYLIVDKKNGKMYVGAAYGDSGIWSRWLSYLETGHGGNKELKGLIKQKHIAYARKNFKFSLLEIHSKRTDDEVILDRESYWKDVLLSRDFGYN